MNHDVHRRGEMLQQVPVAFGERRVENHARAYSGERMGCVETDTTNVGSRLPRSDDTIDAEGSDQKHSGPTRS
jgi:hypothetical protein